MLVIKKIEKNEKKKERRSWKFVKSNIVKLCKVVIVIIILYLWIEWELAVMGTPTKDYSLIEILLDIIRVYLKRVCYKCKSVSYSIN